ncbi:MAG: DNA translocase FtsK 4TM domain-containing protein [Candidatus Saccharibacteria bacterium]|nr:DNA translocase FtsK 4TM domain-containing protein [Candidatus Saccharibacteria bacterium]
MAKKHKGRKSTREVGPEYNLPGGFWRQVFAVFLIVLAIALVATWFGEGGSALNAIHSVMLKGIGYASYFIPVVLVYIAVKIFRAENNRISVLVWIAAFLMVAWLSGVFGLPTIGKADPTGGIVGEYLNKLVTLALNPGVAAIIYIVLILITSLFLLQVSPATFFSKIVGFFRSNRRSEDAENARISRRAEEEGETVHNLKIKKSGFPPATDEPAPKFAIHKAATPDKAPEKEESEDKVLTAVTDPDWKMPTPDLLKASKSLKTAPDGGNLQQNAEIIKSTFFDFGIEVEVDGANVGPRVTQYTLRPPRGTALSKIAARDKELAYNLAVDKIRIEAPIPGTNLIGIEIPNAIEGSVTLRSMLDTDVWKKAKDPLTFICGQDISGNPVVANLAKMPHLLIAGTTGSGKSVMTNTLISSLLFRNAPSDLKLIIVDPKQVEMVQYEDIPHLLTPVINSTDKALSAMKWAVNEMERRYSCMSKERVKKIDDYNTKMANKTVGVTDEDGNEQQHDGGKMPYIVIIIDEMADLMMQAGKDLEALIVRVAQKGRAAGIHLVLATQRPEVKVITGLIKANVPGRIAFAVNNNMDSRIMLDMGGAEKLLGKGDMLMLTTEMMGKPKRVQGAFSPDEDVENLTSFLREQRAPEYNDDVISQVVQIKGGEAGGDIAGGFGRRYDPNDPLVRKAIEITLSKGEFSTSNLQTYLGKAHGWVSGLALWLESISVIGPKNGNKAREVLIKSMDEFDELANQ